MSGRPYDKFCQVDRVERPPTGLERLSRTEKREILNYILKHSLKPFVKYHVPIRLIRKSIEEISADLRLDYEHWSEPRINKFRNKFHRYAMSYGYTIDRFVDKVIQRGDKFYIRRAIFNGRVSKPGKNQELAFHYFNKIVPNFKTFPSKRTTIQFSAKKHCDAARISFSATTFQDGVNVNTNVSQSTPRTRSRKVLLKPSTSANCNPTNSRTKNNLPLSPTFVVKRKPLYTQRLASSSKDRKPSNQLLSLALPQPIHLTGSTRSINVIPKIYSQTQYQSMIAEAKSKKRFPIVSLIQYKPPCVPEPKDRIKKPSTQLLSSNNSSSTLKLQGHIQNKPAGQPIPAHHSKRGRERPRKCSPKRSSSKPVSNRASCTILETKERFPIVSLIRCQPPCVPKPKNRILTRLLFSDKSSSTQISKDRVPNKPASQPISPQHSKRGRPKQRKRIPKRSSGKRLPPCKSSHMYTSSESEENDHASSTTTSLTEEVFDFDDLNAIVTLSHLAAVGNFVASMYGSFGDGSDSEDISSGTMDEPELPEHYPELHEPGFNLLDWLYED